MKFEVTSQVFIIQKSDRIFRLKLLVSFQSHPILDCTDIFLLNEQVFLNRNIFWSGNLFMDFMEKRVALV